jgi:NAD(P)-dependent dehydrogenase (short-subunit alcohol dehydrogenase family)
MVMKLRDKVVVITGGAAGIGQASALLSGREGARVVVLDLDEAEGRKTERALVEQGSECIFLRADVTSEADWMHNLTLVGERFGHVDVLINNAGTNLIKHTTEITEDEWDQIQDLNLKSIFFSAKHAIPWMRRRSNGVVINTASALALRSFPKMAAYCSSKAAVVALTRQLAVEYAPEGIRFNCVCPGPTLTPRIRDYIEQGRVNADDIVRLTPMRRFASPQEIASAIIFLASDEASYITGAVLAVDGGQSAQ